MTLEIFTEKLGETTTAWPADSDSQAELAMKVLDAVQVIVDVLVDEGVQYEASFAALDTAYTDHSKRKIVVSAKPMTEGGKSVADMAAIITGFAVHEIGHTKDRERQFTTAVRDEWPAKVTPHRLANILSDVRLEATTIERFAGLRDVFIPTMDWVRKATCPTGTIAYGKTLHSRLNFVGQAVRYSPWVTFGQDAETQRQLRWWQDWGAVNADTTNEAMLQLVRDGIARVREGAEYEPEPPVGEGEGPGGSTKGGEGNPSPGNPDGDFPDGEDDDADGSDSDGGDTEGEDDDADGEGNGEAENGDDEPTDDGGSATDALDPDEGEGEGKGNGASSESDDSDGESNDGDADDDGDTEGGDQDADGDPDSDTEGEGGNGQLNEGETLDRTESDKPMTDGAGGSGKAVAEAGDDPDEGLDADKLNKEQDDLTEGDWRQQYEDQAVQNLTERERSTTRLDAGAHGRMKVLVEL